jgi:hypothetical protein
MRCKSNQRFVLLAAFVVAANAMLLAQGAYVYVDVSPPEAEVFVDGKN